MRSGYSLKVFLYVRCVVGVSIVQLITLSSMLMLLLYDAFKNVVGRLRSSDLLPDHLH